MMLSLLPLYSRIFAAAWVNSGSLSLLLARMAKKQGGSHPFPPTTFQQRASEQEEALHSASRAYGNALSKNANNISARWGIARVSLVRGDFQGAEQLLLPLIPFAHDNPLLQLDLLTVLAKRSSAQRLLQVYEKAPPPPARLPIIVRDAIALSYLHQADLAEAAGHEEDFVASLRRVLEVRPADLYANYHLKIKAEGHGNWADSEPYLYMLRYYQHEALDPTDKRLLKYTASTIPRLVAERIWNRYQTECVVAFFVYTHTDSFATEQLLRNLITLFPDEPEWVAYIGDLYAQRQQWDQALSVYQNLVSSHPEFSRAYLRLGQLQEHKWGISQIHESWSLDRAYQWYLAYHTRVPDDLMGIKKLADLCQLRPCANTQWSAELTKRLAARRPRYYLNPDRNQLGSKWTLFGYDADEERLVRGEPTEIWLYWLPPDGQQQDFPPFPATWYRLRGRWVQLLEHGRTLVVNGSFELGLNRVLPAGFSPDTTYFPAPIHATAQDRRGVSPTTVAWLQTTKTAVSAGFTSQPIPVFPASLYLQSGWIKCQNPGAYLGLYWVGGSNPGRAPYNYIARAVLSPDWQHFSGLTAPLPGTTAARLWLLYSGPDTNTYFDNVFLVEIARQIS